MTTAEIANEILRSRRFSSTMTTVARNSVFDTLSGVEATRSREEVDWNFALFCASAIGADASDAAQDAALRIAQGCLMSNTSQNHHREAAAILLERMGNRPALSLAVDRELVDSDSWLNSPAPLKLDILRRRMELTIGTSSGESITANLFQRQFWNAALRSSWISVSAPTSAGKSYIVKRWFQEKITISDALTCVYLVPTRALIEEVSNDLRRDQGFARVGIHTLPWDSSIGSNAREVHVVTQERLHVLQQKFPLFAPGVVFVDEAQKFGDDSRGVLLQKVLVETVRRNLDTQVMLASPLSDNPELLLDYAPLSATKIAVSSGSATVNQNLLWVNQKRGKTTRWTIDLVVAGEVTQIGEFSLPSRPSPESRRLPLIAATLGRKSTGNVVYVNGAAEAEKAALQIRDAVVGDPDFDGDSDQELLNLRDLVMKTIHPDYALAAVLRRRVAFHYGNMPLIIRAEIERLFRIGKLRYLVCTSTLLEGVNLPCQNLFVRGPQKGNGRPMSSADFWNLAGRAGRWGKEFQGNIVCVDTTVARKWAEVPRVRSRQPLRRASDDVIGEFDKLIDFITAGAPIDRKNRWPVAESVFNLVADNLLRGRHIAEISGLGLSESAAERLETVVTTALSHVDIPPSIVSKHSGISPLSMQRLLDYFREHDAPERLPLTAPEDDDAASVYVQAISRVARFLGGNFGPQGRRMQLAILLINWMRGRPLAQIIASRVAYNIKRPKPESLSAVIRSTMSDVEQIARFEAPKFLGCYVDILRYHFGENAPESFSELPDIGMMLELGVSRVTELSLMTIGLSRTSAVGVSEYISADDLQPDQCLEWLRDAELGALDLPVLVRREIDEVLAAALAS
ncbi:DEAD/DEAH box helicase [Amycolatopsis orientalis]|uniref:DEAD/DEAH box helicase n=1 Tax=Amycolatopsis orientalis TaxID=31958 RepID=UPI000ACA131B|nr:DEAD/DEAH box helicase [Amycolatopsis orientalis]